MNTTTQNNNQDAKNRRLFLAIAALGVVYGDIGTSPLYAIRECFHGTYGISPTPQNVLGVLSLVFWALTLIVTIKYIVFILRADDNGEGGVMVLTALARKALGSSQSKGYLLLMGMGLFAASLLYGDGMITPAISVLSAVEGISVITPDLGTGYVQLITIIILLALFSLQHRGTSGVGTLFGPITAVWFLVIGLLGIKGITENPQVLTAINPYHGIAFLLNNHLHGFFVLGAVFLVVTGAEALYADLGHFGKYPIRLAWFSLVLPALLCNYFGQGAMLLSNPNAAENLFYSLSPRWALVPLVILATAATIIASQAVISASFSLTYQAIRLGFLPRFPIIHTSEKERGQIYIPQINWLLLIATISLVLGFKTSAGLAAAYGVAVTTTMVITTILFFFVARYLWKWNLTAVIALTALFLCIDSAFFGANIIKIGHGAWFPLAVALVVYILMTTWKQGRTLLVSKLYANNPTLDQFLKNLSESTVCRVPGKAVYMAGSSKSCPPALLLNLKHNKVLHKEIALLTIVTEEIPYIPREEKVEVETLGQGFYRIIAHYGFMENPNVPYILAIARDHGVEFDLKSVSFFIGRETLLRDRRPMMPLWREKIFAFMSRNAVPATAFFNIPAEQVLELSSHVKL